MNPTLQTTLLAMAVATLATGAIRRASFTGGASSRPATEWQSQGEESITPAMVALGDSVFHGKAGGGMCFVCHGAGAKGTAGLAPSLIDAKWIHGDGSYAFIVSTIEKGVPKPKEVAGPMLPKGGTPLSAAQVRAVAAYVYSLSHKR